MTEKILNVETLKKQAKRMKKAGLGENGRALTHTQCLDIVAQYHKYHNWAHLMKEQAQFQRDEKKADNRMPMRDDAHLSTYEQPSYLKAIFR